MAHSGRRANVRVFAVSGPSKARYELHDSFALRLGALWNALYAVARRIAGTKAVRG